MAQIISIQQMYLLPTVFYLKDISHINIALLKYVQRLVLYKIINNTLNYITVNLI